jgi:glycosyltransferase involved in cell wall biosynthesis
MQKPLVFCLTPVKNEAWILERFLQCAGLWADRIIVADQGSTDGSREIAAKFPKVTIVDNPLPAYNELERQQILLAEARRTPGSKVLLALDADEFLSANFLTSPEWESILNAPPGTVISFQWPQIQADVSGLSFSYFDNEMPIGFVDDGTEHKGNMIHSNRVPVPPGCPILAPTHIKLMHYCLMDRFRFESRIRWYQCVEYLTLKKRPIQLYRFYHPVLSGRASVIRPVPREWVQGYEERGIDISSVTRQGNYYWDKDLLQHFEKFGLEKFRRLAIWDVDWSKVHHDLYPQEPTKSFRDPRSRLDKLIHRWLASTQPDFSPHGTPNIFRRFFNKCVQKALGLMGW